MPTSSSAKLSKKKRLRRGLAIIAVVIVGILVAARAYLPTLVRLAIVSQLSQAPGVEARCGGIRLRLWAGQVEAGPLGVSLTEAGKPLELIAWQSLDVRFAPLSTLGSLVRVSHVLIDSPACHLVQNPAGDLNIQRLFSTPESAPSDGRGPASKGVIVETIVLQKGVLTFLDRTLGSPKGVKTAIKDIAAQGEVHYNICGGETTFCSFRANARLVTATTGKLELTGTVRAGHHVSVDCRFRLTGIALKHIDPYCEDSAIQLNGGLADVQGYFRCRDNQAESRFSIQLRNVKVSSRKGVVNQLVVGMPRQAALNLLIGDAGELPLVVEMTGDISDPKFDIKENVMKAIGDAFARRAKQLGNLGVGVLAGGVGAGKKAVDATKKLVDDPLGTATAPVKAAGKVLEGAADTIGKGLSRLNPLPKKKKDGPKDSSKDKKPK